MDYLYVGKSVDVENRWKQHVSKLENGIAAKNMQAAYNIYGEPKKIIIRESHPDHLDVLEPIYIESIKNTYGSSKCLNASIPTVYYRPTKEDIEYFNEDDHYFKLSTIEHVKQLVTKDIELEEKIKELKDAYDNIKELEEVIEFLDNKLMNGNLTDEGERWRQLAKSWEEECTLLNKQLEDNIERNKSWWQKLWA